MSYTSFQKNGWGVGTAMHSYHLEVCSPSVNNVIKIKKKAVSGIFSTTELTRSVELTSLWLIFLVYQEFLFD